MTPEGIVAARLKRRIASVGGECRKVAWEGRIGAPDLLVMANGRHVFVETKAEGQVPRPSQEREFTRLRRLGGCHVMVVSCDDEIDAVLSYLGVARTKEGCRYV